MQTEQIAGPPPKPPKFVIRPGENFKKGSIVLRPFCIPVKPG